MSMLFSVRSRKILLINIQDRVTAGILKATDKGQDP